MTKTYSLQEIAAQVSGYDPEALPVAKAQEFIARLVPCVDAVEMLPLRSALGRVLARDLVSPFDVPAHDNSAMDGYALRGSDLASDAPTFRPRWHGPCPSRSRAVAPGQCLRITTGADAGGARHRRAAGVRQADALGAVVVRRRRARESNRRLAARTAPAVPHCRQAGC
jgi:molybdopterin biosynthesis enzyme